MNKESVSALSVIVAVALLTIYIPSSLHVRYEYIDGDLMAAWYVRLPGWSTAHHPEQTVELQDWVGSKMEGITEEAEGKENPEIEASIALKASGLFNDYELEQVGEHWVLKRPERFENYFTLLAIYRVSPYFRIEQKSGD